MKTPPVLLFPVALAALSCASTAAPVLFIANEDTAQPGIQLNPADSAIFTRLGLLGHTVTVVDDSPSSTADAAGQSLILISSTVTSGNVAGKGFEALAIPVINWENALQDDFLMTLNVDGTDRGTVAGLTDLNITSLSHPITLGIGTGVQTVTTAAETFVFGIPGAGADILGTLVATPNRASVYVYDAGDTLINGTSAPAARIQIFLTDNTFAVVNSTGTQIFDNAVAYALVPEPSSCVLLGLGLAGLAGMRKRRRTA